METLPVLVSILNTNPDAELTALVQNRIKDIFREATGTKPASSKASTKARKTMTVKSTSCTSRFIAEVKDGEIVTVYYHATNACEVTKLSRTSIMNSINNGTVIQKTGTAFVMYDDLNEEMRQSYTKPLPEKPKKNNASLDFPDDVSEAPTELETHDEEGAEVAVLDPIQEIDNASVLTAKAVETPAAAEDQASLEEAAN